MILGMSWVSVSEAASCLGVDPSRVRALAASGELEASRVGSRWLVDAAGVERYAAKRPYRRAGRPFGGGLAWALLAMAAGRPPSWVSGPDGERLLGVLRSRGIVPVIGQLRNRAAIERWYIHPSMVDSLLAEDGVVLGGARASGELASDRGPAEVYVRANDVGWFREQYAPSHGESGHNVVVRVVDDPWPFEPDERQVWPVVAAVDLLESHPDDPRCRAVAESVLERVDA